MNEVITIYLDLQIWEIKTTLPILEIQNKGNDLALSGFELKSNLFYYGLVSDCLEGLKRKKNKIKCDWGEPAKNPLILKLVFSLEFKNSNLGVVETYFHFMWISPYIVKFGVVTCLATSSTCIEVIRFRLNFHNCYRS